MGTVQEVRDNKYHHIHRHQHYHHHRYHHHFLPPLANADSNNIDAFLWGKMNWRDPPTAQDR